MIPKIKKTNRGYYKCTECGLYYEEKKWADKCKAWCSKNSSCNLEITKNSLKT